MPRKQLHPLGQMVLTWLFSMRNLAAISSASPPISPIITIPATDTQTSGTNLSYHHNTYNRHTDIRHQSLLSSQYLQQTHTDIRDQSLLSSQYLQQTHRHQGPISPIITIPTTDTQTSGTNLSYHHNTYNRRTQTSGTNLSYHHNTYNRHTDIRDQSLLSSQYLQQTHRHQAPISPIITIPTTDAHRHQGPISPIITIPTTDTQTSGTNLSYHHNTYNRRTQTSGTNLSYHHNTYNRHTDIRHQSLLSSQYLQQTHTDIRDQSLLSSQYLQQIHRHQGPISPIITIPATDTQTSGTNLSYHHNTCNRHTDIRDQSLLSSQYLQQTHRHQGPISPIITIPATDTQTSGTNLSYHHNTCNRHTDIRHQSLLSSQYLQQTHRHQGPISPIITIPTTDTQPSGTNLSYQTHRHQGPNLSYHHNTYNRHTDIRDQSLLSSQYLQQTHRHQAPNLSYHHNTYNRHTDIRDQSLLSSQYLQQTHRHQGPISPIITIPATDTQTSGTKSLLSSQYLQQTHSHQGPISPIRHTDIRDQISPIITIPATDTQTPGTNLSYHHNTYNRHTDIRDQSLLSSQYMQQTHRHQAPISPIITIPTTDTQTSGTNLSYHHNTCNRHTDIRDQSLLSSQYLQQTHRHQAPISPIITIPTTDTQTSGTNLSYHHNTCNRHTDIRDQSLLSSQYMQQTHRHQGPISPIITIPTTDTQTSGTNPSYHHNTCNRHTDIRDQSLLSSQYMQQTHRHQGPISPIITIPATDTQTSGTNLSYHHNTCNRHTDIRDQSLLSSQYLQQTHRHQGPISPIITIPTTDTDIRDQSLLSSQYMQQTHRHQGPISPIITIHATDTQTSGTNLSYHHNTYNRHTDIRDQSLLSSQYLQQTHRHQGPISPIITIPATDTQTSGTKSLLSSQYLQQTHSHQGPISPIRHTDIRDQISPIITIPATDTQTPGTNLSYHHNTYNRHTDIRDQSLLSSQYMQQTHSHQGPISPIRHTDIRDQISPIITIPATDTQTPGTNLSYHHNTYNRHTDIRDQSLLSSQYMQQTHRHQGPISPIITIHATDTQTSGTNPSYHHNTCNRHTDIRHQSLLSSQYMQQTHRHQGPISPIITIPATDTQTSGTNLSYHHNTCNRHTDIRDQSLLSSQYLQQTHRHQGPISPIITIPATDTQTSGTNLAYHHNTCNRHTYIRDQSLLSSQYLQQTHRHQGPISPIITIPATDTQTSGTNLSYHHNTCNRHTDIRDQSLLSSQYLQQTHRHQGPISPIITIPATDTQTSGTNLSYHHNTCNRHTDIRDQSLLSSQYLQQTHRHQGPISPIITIPATDTQTSGTNLSYHHNTCNRHTDIRDQSLLSSQYLQQTHRHRGPISPFITIPATHTHRHRGPISPIITIPATHTQTSVTNLSYHHNTCNTNTDISDQSLLSSQFLQQTHRHQGPISPIITIPTTDTQT